MSGGDITAILQGAIVTVYAPIVFALVSLQRWIERRQIAAGFAA